MINMGEASMESGRRDFLGTLALGSLAAGAAHLFDPLKAVAQGAGSHWDLSWTTRLKGRRRAVFDVPEIEDGYGVWRAIIWRKQYASVFGVPEDSLSTVVNIRHNGIALVLNQAYWDRYNIATEFKVKDPATREPTRLNPVCARTGENALPAQFNDFTLESLMAAGGIVLGCALAFRDCVDKVAKVEKVSMEEADRRARAMLIPGVILQPSGIFSAVLAQENGCRYVQVS
jgi:hypothetical protein